jgi:hypothetical protein
LEDLSTPSSRSKNEMDKNPAISKQQVEPCLLVAYFLLGLLLNPEDGSSSSTEVSVDYCIVAQYCYPEDQTLLSRFISKLSQFLLWT